MVILSAAITTKSGKPLIARQYRDMSRVRIEGLISAFPKLASATYNRSEQTHTFVETDTVRYVYQPHKHILLVLITTKSSNIVEDLDTLDLLTEIVKSKCDTTVESNILDKAFDLLFAFDEVVSMGYAEHLSLNQVESYLEMESQEESLQELITQSKIEEAKNVAKQEAANLARKRVDGSYPKSSFVGLGKSQSQPSGEQSFNTYNPSSSGLGSSKSSFGYNDSQTSSKYSGYSKKYSSYEEEDEPTKSAPKMLMDLGPKKKSNTNALLKEMMDLGEIDKDDEDQDDQEESTQGASLFGNEKSEETEHEDIHVSIEENLKAVLNHEGNLEKILVKGEMHLTIKESSQGLIQIKIPDDYNKEFNPKTFPKIDKKLFSKESILALSNKSKSFPSGKPLKILTWRYQKKDEEILPFNVTCWPTPSSDAMEVVVEFELTNEDFEIDNAIITIPIPDNEVKVESIDVGTYKVDQRNSELVWNLGQVNSENKNGTFEFKISPVDEEALFPMNVYYKTKNTLSGIDVVNVLSIKDDSEMEFSKDCLLSASYKLTE